MLAKTTTLFALFSVATRFASAAPPACLLAAVNTQPQPSALEAVCSGSNATEVENYICKHCGSDAETAMSGFASVCSRAGVKIDESASCDNSTSSSSSSSGSSASSTKAATITGTGSMPHMTGTGGSMATHTFYTTYFDSACSCTKTGSVPATAITGMSGLTTATGTAGGVHNGTMIAPTGGVAPSAGSGAASSAGSRSGSGSGSGSGASASASGSTQDSGVGRLSMDIAFTVTFGVFVAMLAL
ncbi:hypothetical protein KC331_g6381 [Hortaea werneckii]|uniref:Extracellular membrane protein CFEM domain-containing protein n=1 Tax=Hortaea werneckii TaxID=91943 RepID=A0A3M7C9D0_HORWE|nr:hypothetical protein KC331_g6381 [Hortaea werneckii]KAI7715465.1 hypothetical protein KC353_g6083 [Hortaea werneckii]RMY48762.1 hypothetical protein D0865_07898 [Hortaea werneckii]